jgi:nitroreductase/Pyruvate/2-oxoacid:ferredoxin oxidoreductase delta subunit
MKRRVNPPKILVGKCISCGQCVSVCPSFVLDLVEEKARVVRGQWCIGCGHCGSVCPSEAVQQGVISLRSPLSQGAGSAILPETLEILFRQRRSVRNYTEDSVPQEILKRVLDAGSYGPTGTNSQNVHYLVLTSQDQISHLREMTVRFYDRVFSYARGRMSGFLLSLVAGRKTLEYLRESLPKVEYAYEQMRKGGDRLFYHAPVVVLTHAESWDTCSSFNCSVALYHCSLMAHTLGLGCCFNGFLVNAVNHDRKIRRWLSIPGDHRCYAAMTLGYQNVEYLRPVHRNPPMATWR